MGFCDGKQTFDALFALLQPKHPVSREQLDAALRKLMTWGVVVVAD